MSATCEYDFTVTDRLSLPLLKIEADTGPLDPRGWSEVFQKCRKYRHAASPRVSRACKDISEVIWFFNL